MTGYRMSRRARSSIATSIATCSLALVALASAGPRTTAAVVATCKTSGLVVWIDTRGDAAAGSVFYTLKLTNQSGHSCALTGYPGVSAVDLRGRRLGNPASRTPSQTRVVSLANGETADAPLQISQAANFPASACHPVMAAGLRIYPPDQKASKVVPIPFRACSRTGSVFLHVKAVTRTR